MKKSILFLLIIVSITAAYAAYTPTTIAKLLSKSHLIVFGEIKQVNDEYFLFRIDSVLKGDSTEAVIKVKKFNDWNCAHRFAPYEPGQQEVLFLYKLGKIYLIMGTGDEGEWPFEKSFVYYSIAESNVDKGRKSFHPYGGKIYGYKYAYVEFKEGVKYLLEKGMDTQKEHSLKNALVRKAFSQLENE